VILDLLRHGEAEPASVDGDAGRRLTSTGVDVVRRLGSLLARSGWRPSRAFTSPLVRARDSARLVLEPVDDPPLVETLLELSPDALPDEAIAALEAHGAFVRGPAPPNPALPDDGIPAMAHVLVVTHMPLVARLSGWLAGDSRGFTPGELRRVAFRERVGRGAGAITPLPGGGSSR
jgi:phosphohistidine phosphatase SixA